VAWSYFSFFGCNVCYKVGDLKGQGFHLSKKVTAVTPSPLALSGCPQLLSVA
jgi:hypothetical protein